jgi:F-type H+-transporting ATPase subunit alpha
VISIWAVTNGFLDDLPTERCQEFEGALLDHMRTRHSGIGETIRDTGELDDDTTEKLRAAVEEFKKSFAERVGTVETVAAEEGVPEVSAQAGG